jgi:hypothetical protein
VQAGVSVVETFADENADRILQRVDGFLVRS